MSVLELLKNSPKGQLPYTRRESVSDIQRVLDQVSPVPLSRSHTEREWSKLNLSFGLDGSIFEESHIEDLIVPNDNKKDDSNQRIQQLEDRLSKGLGGQGRGMTKAASFVCARQEKYDLSKDDILNTSLPLADCTDSSSLDGLSRLDIQDKPPATKSSSSLLPELLKFGISSCAIKDEEDRWRESLQMSMLERCTKFSEHEKTLAQVMTQEEDNMRRRMEHMQHSRQTVMDRQMQEGAKETQKVLQKLKETHEEHQMKIMTRQKKIEQQRQKLEEEEKARETMRKEKLRSLQLLMEQVNQNRAEFTQVQDSCPIKEKLGEMVPKFRLVLENVCSKLSAQFEAAVQVKNLSTLDDLIKLFEDNRTKSGGAVNYLKKQVAELEGRVKQEEQKKVEDAKKKEEDQKLEAQAAENCGVQALSHILNEYQAKHNKLAEVEAQLQGFIGNPQMKKYRFDLQRAVNTPINAISAVSGSFLREKLMMLHDLLSGKPVNVSGKRVQATEVPEAPLFCQNLVAKMLVRKGEEQVTSKHDSAFPIAAVAVGLWAEFPLVGELILAHLQAKCPYILPLYSPRREGQSSADYHKTLGYIVEEDGTIEEQDKFLRRMSGLMRFYCACIVSASPKGSSAPHPHGLEQAWMWLARTMNLDPQPDVTAAVIHDMLSVCGSSLFTHYRLQFAKMLQVLLKDYLPKLKMVSVTSATVGRLEIFLDQTLQNNCRIASPEGILQPNFWHS